MSNFFQGASHDDGRGVVHTVHCMVSPAAPPGSSGTAHTHELRGPEMFQMWSCWHRVCSPENDGVRAGHSLPCCGSALSYCVHTGWHSGCQLRSSHSGSAVQSGTESPLQQQQQPTSSCGGEGFDSVDDLKPSHQWVAVQSSCRLPGQQCCRQSERTPSFLAALLFAPQWLRPPWLLLL